VRWRASVAAVTIPAVAVMLTLVLAPHVFAELSRWLEPHELIDRAAAPLAAGRMVDDYWAVQDIDARTIALGEPRYYQSNYAYLIVGATRALLFDSGSGTRDLSDLVRSLTTLPVTVLPSHLHYDHTAGILPFPSIAMIDLPVTRADVVSGRFTAGRYEYLGMFDDMAAPTFTVSEWLAPESVIDLGGRTLQVLSVPGHTPSSVALYDPASHQLFAGDFIYPSTLYAFLPGASRSAYRATTQKLLAMLPPDTKIWTAHCCRSGEKPSAPWLSMGDLRDLDTALAALESGRLRGHGFFPRRFPVNDQMTLSTGFPWNNR
jgi:hydroxyacylglutathione hydrolase